MYFKLVAFFRSKETLFEWKKVLKWYWWRFRKIYLYWINKFEMSIRLKEISTWTFPVCRISKTKSPKLMRPWNRYYQLNWFLNQIQKKNAFKINISHFHTEINDLHRMFDSNFNDNNDTKKEISISYQQNHQLFMKCHERWCKGMHWLEFCKKNDAFTIKKKIKYIYLLFNVRCLWIFFYLFVNCRDVIYHKIY